MILNNFSEDTWVEDRFIGFCVVLINIIVLLIDITAIIWRQMPDI